MLFINNPDSSRYLNIFMMSSISSIEITSDVDPDSWILFSVAAFVADVYVVNSNGIRTMLANVSSTFFIKGN